MLTQCEAIPEKPSVSEPLIGLSGANGTQRYCVGLKFSRRSRYTAARDLALKLDHIAAIPVGWIENWPPPTSTGSVLSASGIAVVTPIALNAPMHPRYQTAGRESRFYLTLHQAFN